MAQSNPDATENTPGPEEVRVVPASGLYHRVDCSYGKRGEGTRVEPFADVSSALSPAQCCFDSVPQSLETNVDFEAQRELVAELEADRPDPTDYTPRPSERLVLAIFADEGTATTRVIRMRGGFDASFASEMCNRLARENWLWRVQRPDENEYGNVNTVAGLYKYNAPADYDAVGAFYEALDGSGGD